MQENASLDFKMLSLNARGIRSPEKSGKALCFLHMVRITAVVS